MLRVLYIFNTAGAINAIAQWLTDNNHETMVLMPRRYDPHGLTASLRCARIVDDSKAFFNEIRRSIDQMKPTHIHVNSTLSGLAVSRASAPYTPIVFQYHGDDVRGRRTSHESVRLLADEIIVSTPDLQKYGEWYGCPVEDRFYYRGGRKPKTALVFFSGPPTIELKDEALSFCSERGLDLTIIDISAGESIPTSSMPEFLSRFEYYLDFRLMGHPLYLSKTAMEAYECGCKVVRGIEMSKIVKLYRKTTPLDYIKLYTSLKKPHPLLTAVRLFYALPRSLPL